MVNDVSAKEMENYFFSGNGCKFQAEYGGKRCRCWNNLFYFLGLSQDKAEIISIIVAEKKIGPENFHFWHLRHLSSRIFNWVQLCRKLPTLDYFKLNKFTLKILIVEEK